MNYEKLFRHPKLIISVCLIITVVLGFFIKDMEINNSTRMFFPQKDASYARLLESEDVYGSMAIVGVSISTNRGNLLSRDNVQVIKKVTDRILELEDVEDVDSLTHIDFVCERDGAIAASQIFDIEGEITDEDVFELKNNLAEWSEMYDRVIVNDDMDATQMQISVTALTEDELKERGILDSVRKENLLKDVEKILKEETKGHHLSYRIYGDDVITKDCREYMVSDLVILIPIVVIVVLLSLFFSFKTKDGTILPLVTVVMATAQTCGLMALLGVQFSIVSSIIPVALIAVGSAYGIHVLTHYYIALDAIDGEITEELHKKAVFDGLKEVKGAVFLAGVTTVIGFISLISSPLGPLHSFAIFTSVGVAISLVLALTFIPALLLVKSVDKVQKEQREKKFVEAKLKTYNMDFVIDSIQKNFFNRNSSDNVAVVSEDKTKMTSDTLFKIFHFFCGTKPRMVFWSLIILIFAFFGVKKLNVETSLLGYFSKTAQINQDVDYINSEFAGTNSLHFLVTGPEKGSITNPELLKAVDDMESYLAEGFPEIGKVVSFNALLKRINQVWHAPSEENVVSDAEISSDAVLDDWGDDWSDEWSEDWGFEETEEDSEQVSDWEDPNKRYLEMLETPTKAADILAMFNQAYLGGGGVHATADSMVDYLEKMFNYNGKAYYEVPYDYTKYPVVSREELKGVVDNYLTLLSGSLDRFLDDDMNPTQMKIQCQLRTHSTKTTKKIMDAAFEFAKENFPEGYTIQATGTAENQQRMTEMIVKSQLESLILSLVSVFVIIAIAFHSLLAGLIGAVPLALTIALNYMVMGFSGINLDLVTSIIASVAVGVGIDYTIHFLTTYKEERAKDGNITEVTKKTFLKSGKGIISNAFAVGLGFLVLCLSKFVVLQFIGVLVAIVMFTSSTLAMTIIPGLLNAFKPKFIELNSKKEIKK